MAYYNEFDPKAAAWLRELQKESLIEAGEVDERSIKDVQEVKAERAHFFAGIGGWDYALQLAGYPTDWPVWTGSCPCQPFSAAGQGRGADDPRHLWPDFRRLIATSMPAVVFGEQVASKAGRAWLAGVRAEMEALGYAFGAADLCAASINAPHIRQRLFWVAYSKRDADFQRRITELIRGRGEAAAQREHIESGRSGSLQQRLGDASGERGRRDGGAVHREEEGRELRQESHESESPGDGLGDAVSAGRSEGWAGARDGQAPWSRSVLVRCIEPTKDGGTKEKWRRVEPGIEPLAHGISGRVGLLRGYGNAIVPQIAAEFIGAFLDTLQS